MSSTADKALNDLVEAKVKEILDQRLDALVEEKFQNALKNKPKRMAIAVVSKGTIEAAYAALILGTTAAAMDIEAGLYFSFFGLNILKKENQGSLKVVPLGNPAMPVTMPNIVSVLPGMTDFATMMMKRTIKKKKIATVEELMEI
ncbi:MAG TPA: DsrE/DsrF/DrsH-like family protein, partial [Nitrospiria bacterium]